MASDLADKTYSLCHVSVHQLDEKYIGDESMPVKKNGNCTAITMTTTAITKSKKLSFEKAIKLEVI